MDETILTIDDLLRGIAAIHFVGDNYRKSREIRVFREKESLVQALDKLKQYVLEERTNLEFTKLSSNYVLPRHHSDYERLAREVAQLTFQKTDNELNVTQNPEARSAILSNVYHQVLGAGDSREHAGLVKNGMLMLESLEKIALSLDHVKEERGVGQFETYLIVPIANIFLKGGDYERFMKLVELCNPKGLLQAAVKSVIYDNKDLFNGVEFNLQGNNLPGFYSNGFAPEYDKGLKSTSTSILQRPDNPLLGEQPRYWNISTTVHGKPFWGLKPFGKDETNQNINGYIDVESLNLALRLNRAARTGNKSSYGHILSLIKDFS